MESVDAKLNRAQEHLDTLEREVRDFLETAVRRTIPKIDGDSAYLIYFIKDPIAPIHISAVIGDCVFNMRSALDNPICGLIRTKNPTSRCVKTKFPIYSKLEEWNRHWKCDLKGVPVDAQTLIQALQPCFRADKDPSKDLLFILNQLSNMDKHRSLLITAGHDRNVQFTIYTNDGGVHYVTVEEPIFSGDFATIPLSISPTILTRINPVTLVPEVNVQGHGTGVIAFSESGPWGEYAAHAVLALCLQYIKEIVIPRFKPFFC
jgi:hypothetical protein